MKLPIYSKIPLCNATRIRPAFNTADIIERRIRSIFFTPGISGNVVVNKGSTDDRVAKVETFAANTVSGTGLKLAMYEGVTLLNAKYEVLPGAISGKLLYLKEYSAPNKVGAVRDSFARGDTDTTGQFLSIAALNRLMSRREIARRRLRNGARQFFHTVTGC